MATIEEMKQRIAEIDKQARRLDVERGKLMRSIRERENDPTVVSIGDKLLATPDFVAILEKRRRENHPSLFRGWVVGGLLTLVSVDKPEDASVRCEHGSLGDTGRIPWAVIVGMREAYLSQFDAEPSAT